MKNFNKKIYAINRQTVDNIKSNIPSDYFKMATKIANSYSKDYSAIGVMNINDLNQEAYLALLTAWSNIDWKYINKLESKQGQGDITAHYQTANPDEATPR